MIQFYAHKRSAVCDSDDRLTTGSVGIEVVFHFSDDWAAAPARIAVFRGSGVSVDVALLEDSCTVPPEVLTQPGSTLSIGVYGTDGAGKVVIPTVYAEAGRIVRGAEPSGVEPTPQTQPLIDQLLAAAKAARDAAAAAERLAQSVRDDADAGEFDGADGTRSWWTNSRVISAAAYESDGGVATIQLHSVDGATPAVGDYVYAPEVGQSGAPTALYVITQTAPVLTVFDRICSIKGDGGSGTGDYDDLTNKPQIAGVTLSGDKSLSDLGVAPKPMLVTLSHTGSGDTYTADKTYAEITDAIAAGREVLVDWGASILRPSALGATWIGYDDSQILEFILHSDSSWTGIITDLGSYRTAADQDTIDRQQNAAIEAKYTKPGTGVPKTDLAAAVQTSLGRADTALQQHQDISGKADKVTEVTVSTAGDVTQALDAGKIYHFTGALTALTLTLNAAAAGQQQYHLDFVSGATAPTVTIPATVTMPDGWTVEANTRYEIDILDGYGVAQSWEVTA